MEKTTHNVCTRQLKDDANQLKCRKNQQKEEKSGQQAGSICSNCILILLILLLQSKVYKQIETLMIDIFEKQFHVLKLCFDMFNTSFIYNPRFNNLGNYKKMNVLYNNSLKVS